jgi:hypothetical protein
MSNPRVALAEFVTLCRRRQTNANHPSSSVEQHPTSKAPFVSAFNVFLPDRAPA